MNPCMQAQVAINGDEVTDEVERCDDRTAHSLRLRLSDYRKCGTRVLGSPRQLRA
jgi:hypothetical protein